MLKIQGGKTDGKGEITREENDVAAQTISHSEKQAWH